MPLLPRGREERRFQPPVVAGSIDGSVFPAESAGVMAGAPAAAGTRRAATSAPAVAISIGGKCLPR